MKPLKIIRYILLSLLLIGMPLADTAILVFANDVSPIEYDEGFDNLNEEATFEDEDLIIPDEIVAETEEDNQAPLVQEDSLPDTAEDAACSQRVVAEGRFANQPGEHGLAGAPWRLCEGGLLEVDEGFIHWESGWTNPWHPRSHQITNIVFTGLITAGSSLRSLFASLFQVTTIEGLEHFDTSHVNDRSWMFQSASSLTHLDVSNWDTGRVTNMSAMFTNASSLTELDLSNWDTSHVTLMASMFTSASSLTELDLSNWNTSHVTDMRWLFQNASSLTSLDLSNWDTSNAEMDWMFTNTNSLSQLTLGQQFTFRGNPQLPAVTNNTSFTGYWQNIGNGTRENPTGEFIFTSAELMANFNGQTMADTFVWQPVNPQLEQGRILALGVNDFHRAIDQEARTITFHVPEASLIFGRLLGTISVLDADDESVILSTEDNEFRLRKGMFAIFLSGDTISTPDGIVYTIQIIPYVEESRIFSLSVNQFQASINQEDQTITFHVPTQSLFFGNLLLGSITHLQADSESMIVSFNGINQELRQGNQVILSSGEAISTPDGVVYTIQIIPV